MTHHLGDPTPTSGAAARPDGLQPHDLHPDDAQNLPPENPPPADPVSRWTLSRKVTIWSILVPLVAVFAGALFSASSGAAQGTDLRSAASGLADVIRDETRRGEIRANEVGRLQGEVDQLTQARKDRDELVEGIVTVTERYAPAAGTTSVQGPGLSVSLTDSPLRGDAIPPGLTVDDLVVHQQDVQGVVNALWRGGAEAMMIQDQRIISTSAVRCVGNTLILQGRVYSPPFVITAIGDPDRLQRALDNDPTVQTYREYVPVTGLGYAVERKKNIEAPPYAGSISLQHATPLRGPDAGR
ncbi:MAG TPA: DUF881 domain-containing protein [Intrasporangiaceae bacterium]|nr:DUF881 domain-containing protein [Intrasporangiaceae bacterium]